MRSPDINHDKEALKLLVIDTISKQCISAAATSADTNNTPSDILALATALNNGYQLELTILSGGLANYSYKVSCTDESTNVLLFAKFTFAYALVLPDKPCPLDRTQYEFDGLKIYKNVVSNTPGASDAAVTPYFCIDVEGDHKLLVTQFSPLDEQAANQFIDGSVDLRVASKLAISLAALHSKNDFDPNHNADIRPFVQDLVGLIEEIFDGMIKEEGGSTDRPTALAKSMGKAVLDNMITAYRKELDATDCIVHGDCHMFNMLVEAKPSIETLENYGQKGDIVLIDWEFSRCGPIGIDVGFVHPFPIACVLTHAMNGELSSSENILKFLDTLWNEYSSTVQTGRELSDIYRTMLSFTGVILIVYYKLGFHLEFLPLDDNNVEGLNRVKESIGVIGLKFLSWGFGNEEEDMTTLPEIRKKFKDAVAEEVQLISPTKKMRGRTRRSSMLRVSGRRVSDAYLVLGGSVRDMTTLMEADAELPMYADDEN